MQGMSFDICGRRVMTFVGVLTFVGDFDICGLYTPPKGYEFAPKCLRRHAAPPRKRSRLQLCVVVSW